MSLRQFVPPPYRIPWSHTPGIEGWLAGSCYSVKVFPTRLELYSHQDKEKKCCIVLSFPKLSFSNDWTVFFDTLRQRIIVQGHSKGAFFRYHICVTEEGIFLETLKESLYCNNEINSFLLHKGEKSFLVKGNTSSVPYLAPRLLLGMNKDPYIDRMLAKPDLLELLSYWYQFGGPFTQKKFSSSLFSTLINVIEQNPVSLIEESLMEFFRAGIQGYFVPKIYDDLYHGFQAPLLPKELLLEEVHGVFHAFLRSLFLRQKGSVLTLLPNVPKQWQSGHLLRERLFSTSFISIEWRKSLVRRVLIHAKVNEELFIDLPPPLSNFSFSILGKRNSKRISSRSSLMLEPGLRYLLDHFS